MTPTKSYVPLLDRSGFVPRDLASVRVLAEKYAAAWSSHDPDAVASFYEENGSIIINQGDPVVGRSAISTTAAGFYAAFPDLVIHLDNFRLSGNHVLLVWTMEGKHSETGNFVKVDGWWQWTLGENLHVRESFGWFDVEDYDRQIAGG